jgi:hypothetical protein
MLSLIHAFNFSLQHILSPSVTVFTSRCSVMVPNNGDSSALACIVAGWLPSHNTSSTVDSQSVIDSKSVRQSVLASSPILGSRPDFCYWQIVAVLSMWGALSDERPGLLFTAVTVSSTCHLYTILHVSILHGQSVVKSPVPCGYILFTVLNVTLICMYNIYKASVSLGFFTC